MNKYYQEAVDYLNELSDHEFELLFKNAGIELTGDFVGVRFIDLDIGK
jgi:hypothetical protein